MLEDFYPQKRKNEAFLNYDAPHAKILLDEERNSDSDRRVGSMIHQQDDETINSPSKSYLSRKNLIESSH